MEKENKKTVSLFNFIVYRNLWQFRIAVLAIIIAIILYLINRNLDFAGQWSKWLEFFMTFTIILISLFIWYNEQKEEWVNGLEKKLNITYLLKEGEVYEDFCYIYNAPLSHEGDIRTWGQSIGQTILNERVSIEFAGFTIDKPIIDYNKGRQIYHLIVYLYKPIEYIEKGEKINFEDAGFVNRDKNKNTGVEKKTLL